MTIYLTVRDLTLIFSKSTWTIRRWVHEGRTIVHEGYEYIPMPDPAGRWRFKRIKYENSVANMSNM